jgi:peptidoglycan/LPS O-acetylase OafA/YrhL
MRMIHYSIGYPKFGVILLSAALIVSIVKGAGGVLEDLLSNRVFLFLGVISYSIYMSHAFVIAIMNSVIKRIFVNPSDSLGSVAHYEFIQGSLALLFTLVMIIIVSYMKGIKNL